MNQPEDLRVDPPVVDALPAHTTPTWEVELLISGVAVFAMLQLPGLLDDAIFAWRPRFSQEWSSVVFLLYVYSKGAAVLLAGTFVVHLLLRARWIALVGLHSIHPARFFSRLPSNDFHRAHSIPRDTPGSSQVQMQHRPCSVRMLPGC